MVIFISSDFLDLITLAAFIFPFYADEFSTMIVRLKDGESLLRPHRRHLYQLLANELEVPHWKVSTAYGIVQLVVCISVLVLRPFGGLPLLLGLVSYFIAFGLVSYSVRKKVAA